ncbi:RND family efflux transporter MFP subunit [Actimicrobium sp. GrIS 1.19]|uniref:efflux RND transporter periplasmic adaptor subunit n=1 Tax=Actimicrobium sp. GrIS 1.19 TaxID=3071708 RepID=UPI002E067654|nr:RND family efflux transporter MFP subunit [Actimicrobium sp. GrIS 1.19]
MRLNVKILLFTIVIVTAFAVTVEWFRSKSTSERKGTRNAVQTVRTGLAQTKAIPVTLLANGYVTPINIVDVRPQLQNLVREVHVKEGQDVRVGQLLFTLDQRNDAFGMEKARAQVARDRADLADAQATLNRNEELLAKKFVSQAVIDTARSRVDALRSTLQADQAVVASSGVALGYNQIRASISGRIGVISVYPGSLAQPGGAPMLTISQIDPIAVAFTLPERELAYLRKTYPQGDAPVFAKLADGSERKGTMTFIDNSADTQSGTIRMKARFDNADRSLWPGAFVSVRLVSRTLPDAVVVPAQALVTGPIDQFIYVVQGDDSVAMQKVEVVVIEDGLAAVTGLNAGVRVVIEGAQNLRPGVKVKEMVPVAVTPAPATITVPRAP